MQVRGIRASSLPSQIPTPIEGITGADVAEKTNATDAEDALKYFPSLLVRKRYIGDYDHAVLAREMHFVNQHDFNVPEIDGKVIVTDITSAVRPVPSCP